MAFIKPLHPDSSGDAELVSAFKKNGEQRHVEQLFLRYADLIFGVCLKYLGDAEKSKDAAMDIYLQLPDKLRRHDVNRFKSWIHVVAKNHCLMLLRGTQKGRTVALEDGFMQSAENIHPENEGAVLEEQLLQLEQCIDTLPADQQTCVRLFYLENRCYKEIASQTGLEWSQVRSHIQNGKRNLKICMEKQGINLNS